MTRTIVIGEKLKRLTDIAEEMGWMRDGMQGHFPKYKKGDVVISICNTCGGGFVNIIEPKPNRFYRNDARKYLQDA